MLLAHFSVTLFSCSGLQSKQERNGNIDIFKDDGILTQQEIQNKLHQQEVERVEQMRAKQTVENLASKQQSKGKGKGEEDKPADEFDYLNSPRPEIDMSKLKLNEPKGQNWWEQVLEDSPREPSGPPPLTNPDAEYASKYAHFLRPAPKSAGPSQLQRSPPPATPSSSNVQQPQVEGADRNTDAMQHITFEHKGKVVRARVDDDKIPKSKGIVAERLRLPE